MCVLRIKPPCPPADIQPSVLIIHPRDNIQQALRSHKTTMQRCYLVSVPRALTHLFFLPPSATVSSSLSSPIIYLHTTNSDHLFHQLCGARSSGCYTCPACRGPTVHRVKACLLSAVTMHDPTMILLGQSLPRSRVLHII